MEIIISIENNLYGNEQVKVSLYTCDALSFLVLVKFDRLDECFPIMVMRMTGDIH
jgi:hypothetical protein